jgi:DNA repair photolyase
MVKTDAPNLLRRELSHPRWSPQTLAMSGVTDCYQPVERSLKLTRQCLEVLADFRNPVGLVTKNHLVTRDLDILQELHRYECVKVYISITSLQSDLAGVLEPRAARPAQRLEIVRQLASAGVPVGVIIAPVIPGLNDVEIPALLEAAAAAGAGNAHYVLLRLPHAVKDIFSQWLENHYPEKKDRVLGLIRETREGRLNQTDFGTRMKGTGAYAQHIEDLFRVSKKRVGLGRDEILSTRHFRRPGLATQLALL